MSLLNLLEEFIMFEKIRKMKNKKGFTLVELIVVLVILAILAALLIPALTGYIDKANEEKVIAECRMATMAAQTESSVLYGKMVNGADLTSATKDDLDKAAAEAVKLGEYKAGAKVSVEVTLASNGAVTQVIYKNQQYTCTYKDGAYTTKKESNTISTGTFVIKVTGSTVAANGGSANMPAASSNTTTGGK